MTQCDSDTREKQEDGSPRDRASALAEAILEISASLDLDTVVRRVVEVARSLTGAQRGIIATIDESGAPGEFFFSGYTDEEQRELLAWPHSLELFAHFRELPGPLREGDFAGYARALGLTPLASFSMAFQGTPMRHRGTNVGYFFLGGKAGGAAFTDADEEVLVLFASQAAAAIANARAHRGEQRARRDLEALIETSPVGVVVFDRGSGRMASYNREARRIVESLRMPGRPVEELLGTVVCRRADGREVSLAEFPLAQQFASPETVRAEEVVLSVPDGRSVRTLINATPIKAEGPVPGSVVVTMQDLAPLDEIERLRTEFLGLVSHELRAPLTSIKGSAVTLTEQAAGLDPAEMREFFRIIVEQADRMQSLIADLLDTGRHRLGHALGLARAVGGGGPGGRGQKRLPRWRRPARSSGRPCRRPAAGHGGSAAHRAGAEQPAGKRRPAHAGVGRHPRDGRSRRTSCRVLGRGRRGGRRARAAAAPLQQERRRGRRHGEPGAGARDLQGAGRGARGAHPRRKRRPGPGDDDHLHDPGCGGAGRYGGLPRRYAVDRGRWGAAAYPGDRRRPAHAALRARHADEGGLRPGGYRRTGRPRGSHPRRAAAARAARPAAVRPGRNRAAAGGSRTLRLAGDTHLRLRPRRDGRNGPSSRAPTTTSSSPSRRPSWWRASARRCAGTGSPRGSCWASSRSSTSRAGSRWAATRWSSPPRSTNCCASYRSMPDGSCTSTRCCAASGDGREGADANLVRIFVRTLRRKLGDDAEDPTWIFNLRGVGYRMPRPGER